MPRFTRSARVVSITSALAFSLAIPAQARCPPSTVAPFSNSPHDTTVAVFDVTTPGSEPVTIHGDHRIEEFSLHNPGYLDPAGITARDLFDVTGVPAGTPVDVTVHFHVDGWAFTAACGGGGCCGRLEMTLKAGGTTTSQTLIGNSFSGRADFAWSLELPLTIVAGTPQLVEVGMSGGRCPGGAHTVDATGTVHFSGIDPNASVVSCKGYGPRLVPALPTTWGRLKQIYR